MASDNRVAAHYAREGLIEEIFEALQEAGKDIERLTPTDLEPIDHFHSRGVEATADLADALAGAIALGADSDLIDLGCGLGGPARYFASRFGCRVHGVDLTPEFCDLARQFNDLTGLTGRIAVRQGSVLELPYDDALFDAAYTQNVSMNIADRVGFYREAYRILKPGGVFAAAEVCLGDGGDVLYPVPWAETQATSHLMSEEENRSAFEAAGFTVLRTVDVSDRILEAHARARKRVAREGPPLLGIHLILGDRFKAMGRNTVRNVEERRTLPFEFLCRRDA